MQNITAVAFDLDGTLYPNYQLNMRLLPFILREWRLLAAFGKARDTIRAGQDKGERSGEAAGEPKKGIGFYEVQAALAAEYLKADPAIIRGKIETLIYRGWEPHFKKIKLFPHVLETISSFREKGLKLGLLSDFPPEKKLQNLGISELWDAVLSSEEISALKPDARPFDALAAALKTGKEHILYVGNSARYDVAGAKRAGMKTALICSAGAAMKNRRLKPLDPQKADFTFHDYRQLCKYMLD
jgi:putative hydrolase of the HAD superfamily